MAVVSMVWSDDKRQKLNALLCSYCVIISTNNNNYYYVSLKFGDL